MSRTMSDDKITEGMELTEPNGSDVVYVIRGLNGNDAYASIWEDGRRKRKETLSRRELDDAYKHGELVEAEQ